MKVVDISAPMVKSAMKIAVAQVEIAEKVEKNLETALNVTSIAAKSKADLIVFPEMFMLPAGIHDNFATVVARKAGKFLEGLREMSRKFRIFVISGIWELSEESKGVYNTVVAINSNGDIVSQYRKIHLFNALNIKESNFTMAGNNLPEIFELCGFKLATIICYDLRFPELARSLAASGCEVLIVPAAWYGGIMKEEHWKTLLQARAIENTMFVVGCNTCGRVFCGRSTVFDPFGVCVGSAGEEDELLVVQISRDRLERVRAKLPSLTHLRHDVFTF